MKKIVFLTGTRADFGKLKSLIHGVNSSELFEVHIFATGMHMLEKYGATVHEILKEGFNNVYMYNNSAFSDRMDVGLANTIYGFSNYVKELNPDLIIVHGDRAEALAGAIVGSFNNILVGHIEGGEVSGTIDDLIRHSVSKLSHAHFVANGDAEEKLLHMGERPESIFKIGSPEIDLMLSDKLPSLDEVRLRYDVSFNNYGILIYHPVTTEYEKAQQNIREVVDAVIDSKLNYIVIAPNNDRGTEFIAKEYERIKGADNIKFFRSIRFEYFLTLLQNSQFILGNSSCGVREAAVYAVPSINVGTRQKDRFSCESIFNVSEHKEDILLLITKITNENLSFTQEKFFGDGKSMERFKIILEGTFLWNLPLQKQFDFYWEKQIKALNE